MTKSFRLYALGSNGSGQLGIGHRDDTAIPRLCIFDKADTESISPDDRITKIVAGGNHTLVLFKSGAVFAAGNNEHRQCCLLPRIVHTSIFRLVTIHASDAATGISEVVHFTDISATWEASFLLGQEGQVYVFGAGSKGELGLGSHVTATRDLREAQIVVINDQEHTVSKLCSGVRHTVAITTNGEVYGWGSCRKRELGKDLEHRKQIWAPGRLNLSFECQKAIAGRNFTIFFGSSCCKAFGQDNALQEIEKWAAPLVKEDIEAGWSTAYALLNKRVRVCGRDDRGQWPPIGLPDLKTLGAGSEHCLGLTTDGRVLVWGWGEHGNCGQPTDLHRNVVGRWNILSIPLEDDEEVVNVAAGCATSFVVVEKTAIRIV